MDDARHPSLLRKALISVIKVILTQKIPHCVTNMMGGEISGHRSPPLQ